MKVVGKILLGIIGSIDLVIVIFLTACLLNYNDYNVTEFSRDTLIIIGKDAIEKLKSAGVPEGKILFLRNKDLKFDVK